MATTNKKFLEHESDGSDLADAMSGIQSANDADLGFKMFHYVDGSSNLRKCLVKDQLGRLTDLYLVDTNHGGIMSGRIIHSGDTDNYIELQEDQVIITKETNFSDRITYAGTFAEIHAHDNATADTVATGATYVKSAQFDTSSGSGNCTADTSNNKITLTKTGYYLVSLSVSFISDTDSIDVYGACFLDAAIEAQIQFKQYVATGANTHSTSISGVVDNIMANQDIDFRWKHSSGSSVDITPVHINLSAHFLGDT